MTYSLEPLPGSITPKDYHRIHFDPSQLPSKRIVGLLACQRDPLLRKLRTKVVSAQPASVSEPPPAKGRAKQKKKDPAVLSTSTSNDQTPNGTGMNTPVEKGTLWEVEVEDTVIFPEGGGQPFDVGWMRPLGVDLSGQAQKSSDERQEGEEEQEGGLQEGKKGYVVEGCLRRKLDSVHLVRVPPGSPGLQDLVGREVEVEVDWVRRMDHMSIHTAQHLLSAILDTFAEGLNTLSWGFAPHPSLDTPYVELPRGMTWKEVEEVEKRCNEAIEKGVKIWVDVGEQEEGFVKETASGVRENRGIPEDYNNGVIRYINIEGIDKNACCGTQLPHLGYLSFIHIIPPSTPLTSSKPTQTPTRLFFTAGPRAIRYMTQTSRNYSLAAQSLLVGRNDLVERVEKMDNQRREVISREKDLRGELAKLIGEGLSGSASVNDGGEGADGGRGKVVYLKREEKSTHDFEFLGNVAGSMKDYKLGILVSTATTPNLIMVLSPDGELAKEINEKIKNGLNGIEDELAEEGRDGRKGPGGPRYKGGGAKGRYMGKLDGKWGKKEDEVLEGIIARLRG